MKKKAITLLLGLSLSISMFGCGSNETIEDITYTPPSEQIADLPSTLEETLPKEEAPTPSVGPLGIPDNQQTNKDQQPKKETPSAKKETPPAKKETPPPATPTPAPPNPAPPVVKEPANPKSPPAVNATSDFLATVEQQIYTMVNAEREKAGVKKLSYDTTMEKYGRIKSKDMGVKNYFSHEDPNGKLITEQMKSDGVSYKSWGENIAYSTSPETVVATQFMNNWMNSEGHRKNILSPNFTGIGIGVCKVNGKIYATQEFVAK